MLCRRTTRSDGIGLIEQNAPSAGAVCHALMKFAAKPTYPKRPYGKGQPVFAITKKFAWFNLIDHVGGLPPTCDNLSK